MLKAALSCLLEEKIMICLILKALEKARREKRFVES